MKCVFFFMFLTLSHSSFANLYLQSEYQEGSKPKVITKQHIFLDKREVINYSKKGYVLILKKITKDEATIESESYDIDQLGHKTMTAGSLGTYKVGKSFSLIDQAPNGKVRFKLNLLLERIVK